MLQEGEDQSLLTASSDPLLKPRKEQLESRRRQLQSAAQQMERDIQAFQREECLSAGALVSGV